MDEDHKFRSKFYGKYTPYKIYKYDRYDIECIEFVASETIEYDYCRMSVYEEGIRPPDRNFCIFLTFGKHTDNHRIELKKYIKLDDISLNKDDNSVTYKVGYMDNEDDIIDFPNKDTLAEINIYFTPRGYMKILNIYNEFMNKVIDSK